MTEREEALAQKNKSEERFATLFEKTYSPVLIHENGRILALNRAITERFGYPAEMLIGQKIQTLIEALTPYQKEQKS